MRRRWKIPEDTITTLCIKKLIAVVPQEIKREVLTNYLIIDTRKWVGVCMCAIDSGKKERERGKWLEGK